MKSTDIKPLPKYILAKLRKLDLERCPGQKGHNRLYSYLTTIKGGLVKITVAVKFFYGKWHCKQVAVYGMKSQSCFVKDMAHHRISGYKVSWHPEGYRTHQHHQWWADGKWYDDDRSSIKWNPFSFLINPEYVGKFPKYQFSAYQHFRGDCMIDYLKIYLQYPQAEFLLKFGLQLLHNKVTILKNMAKDKQFWKWLLVNRDEISSMEECYAGAVLQAYKTKRPIKQVQKIEKFKKKLKGNSDLAMLHELFGNNLEQFYGYIRVKEAKLMVAAELLPYTSKNNAMLAVCLAGYPTCAELAERFL